MCLFGLIRGCIQICRCSVFFCGWGSFSFSVVVCLLCYMCCQVLCSWLCECGLSWCSQWWLIGMGLLFLFISVWNFGDYQNWCVLGFQDQLFMLVMCCVLCRCICCLCSWVFICFWVWMLVWVFIICSGWLLVVWLIIWLWLSIQCQLLFGWWMWNCVLQIVFLLCRCVFSVVWICVWLFGCMWLSSVLVVLLWFCLLFIGLLFYCCEWVIVLLGRFQFYSLCLVCFRVSFQ